jgi:formyltetrahydrofolate deformylase
MTAPHLATLRVSCADRTGLVAALAQLLYGYGVNILDADQHTDREAGQFFQRIRMDLSQARADRVVLEQALTEVCERFGMKWQLNYDADVQRIAVFVSEYDHCLYDLLWRHQSRELPGNVVLVVSNHETLRRVAEQFGVEFRHVPITPSTKLAQEQAQIALLREHRVDLVVLARYMQILSDDFVREFPERIINIHHSFLPAFVGSKPYHRAAERGVKLIGATAHYVTAKLDEGPIIEQDVVRSSHKDEIADLIRKGRDIERQVLSRAVRWHLNRQVLVYANKTVVFG